MSGRDPSGRPLTLYRPEGRPALRSAPPPGRETEPPANREGQPRGGGFLWTAGILVLVAAMLAGALWIPGVLDGDSPEPPEVVGSLPVWNLAEGSRTIADRADSLTAASPNVYEVAPDGGITSRRQPPGISVAEGLGTLRAADIPIVPIVSNTRDGNWDPELIRTILHDPNLVRRHVEAIVALVLREDFAGIDIDYEELTNADREAFSDFITALGVALHAEDRILAVDLFAKESDEGYDQRNLAQDYAAIGRSADQVRLMGYDWHWQTSEAGPIAPLDWIRRVLAYAVTEIPPEKIVLGIPTYGYGWAGSSGRLVSWLQAYAASKRYGVPTRWDVTAESPWLVYRDEQGVEHTLWFENSYSIRTKLAIAHAYGIGGVHLWLVGDEDDGMWPLVSAYHSGSVEELGAP